MAAPTIYFFYNVAILLVTYLAVIKGDVDYEGATTFSLEHTFQSGDDAVWTKRGAVTVRSLKPGRTHISQATGPNLEEVAQLTTSAVGRKIFEIVMNDRAVKNNGLYRVRIPVKTADTATPDSLRYVSSFTLACALYESRLSDDITISLDQSGEAIGVSIVTHPGVCSGQSVNDTDLSRYNTTVEISQSVTGPVPDTQTYVEKMKKEESERAKGQHPDNRSFFAKYWMYIVPGVIIMLLMNSMDPQAGGGAAR